MDTHFRCLFRFNVLSLFKVFTLHSINFSPVFLLFESYVYLSYCYMLYVLVNISKIRHRTIVCYHENRSSDPINAKPLLPFSECRR